MKTPVYIISFGNSIKYRFTPGNDTLDGLSSDIKGYLSKKFPQLPALSFYDKMTVMPVDTSNAEEYAGYKNFDSASLEEIKKILSEEVETAAAISRLNSNAPWNQ